MAIRNEIGARVTVEVHADDLRPEIEQAELRQALTESPRRIPSKYFYDDLGSRLFDEITRLPEYYPTRTEAALLALRAGDIIARTGAEELVELGSGTATKTRILLDAMAAARTLRRYIPFDVSEAVIRDAAGELTARYPDLRVHGVVGDFARHLDEIPNGERRLIIFLGSTIGNFEGPTARRFLRRVAGPMRPGDFFLLGVDLIKDADVLEAAYNDAQGLTARFNRHILETVNERFGGDFEPAAFRHRAFFDHDREWIEMRLVSRRRQRVGLVALDLAFELTPGEEIRTEISTKYTREKAESLLVDSGFHLSEWWTDELGYFGLALARRRQSG